MRTFDEQKQHEWDSRKKHKFGGRTKAPEPEPPKVTVRKSPEHAKAHKAAAARQRKIATMVAKGYPKHIAEQHAGAMV